MGQHQHTMESFHEIIPPMPQPLFVDNWYINFIWNAEKIFRVLHIVSVN